MKLSELIKQLQEIEKEHGGDLEAKRIEFYNEMQYDYYDVEKIELYKAAKFIAIE
jgi:hypothetical protein